MYDVSDFEWLIIGTCVFVELHLFMCVLYNKAVDDITGRRR